MGKRGFSFYLACDLPEAGTEVVLVIVQRQGGDVYKVAWSREITELRPLSVKDETAMCDLVVAAATRRLRSGSHVEPMSDIP